MHSYEYHGDELERTATEAYYDELDYQHRENDDEEE